MNKNDFLKKINMLGKNSDEDNDIYYNDIDNNTDDCYDDNEEDWYDEESTDDDKEDWEEDWEEDDILDEEDDWYDEDIQEDDWYDDSNEDEDWEDDDASVDEDNTEEGMGNLNNEDNWDDDNQEGWGNNNEEDWDDEDYKDNDSVDDEIRYASEYSNLEVSTSNSYNESEDQVGLSSTNDNNDGVIYEKGMSLLDFLKLNKKMRDIDNILEYYTIEDIKDLYKRNLILMKKGKVIL